MKNFSILLTALLSMECNEEIKLPVISYSEIHSSQCSRDTLHVYHYTIPIQQTGKLPLLIILDSGGDGLFAVKKLQPAAGNFAIIMAGSDLIKNNYPDFIRAISLLIDDVAHKFPVAKDQVYLAGFSGGARMAFEYARQFPVKGVLMCGAGPETSKNLPCPVYMIAGTTDFNFAEMYYNPWLSGKTEGLLLDYFRGGHEWPPPEKIKNGLLFLAAPKNRKQIKAASRQLSDKADSLMDRHEALFSIKAAEMALVFDPSNRIAKKIGRKIMEDKHIRENIHQLESDLNLERKIGQAYVQASFRYDSIWWAKEIDRLLEKIDGSEGEQKNHFLRIKAFLGILYYSRLNTMLSSDPWNPQIENLLPAYRLIEPNNPDVYYAYARYEKKKGNDRKSSYYLNKSYTLGFKDKSGVPF
ncbi:MAG TPA: hypothetical protein VHI78_06775 [Bacteroidales bacterium]|nr:hypothetical protein [Bacteroidales bacterium]